MASKKMYIDIQELLRQDKKPQAYLLIHRAITRAETSQQIAMAESYTLLTGKQNVEFFEKTIDWWFNDAEFKYKTPLAKLLHKGYLEDSYQPHIICDLECLTILYIATRSIKKLRNAIYLLQKYADTVFLDSVQKFISDFSDSL